MENKCIAFASPILRRTEREIAMPIKPLIAAAAAMLLSAVAYAEPVDPAQAIAQKFSEASDIKTPPQRSFDQPDNNYEQDMLQRARAEEAARQEQDARQAAPQTMPAVPDSTSQAPARPAELSNEAPKIAALPANVAAPDTSPGAPEADASITSQATVLLVIDPNGAGLHFKPDPIICIDDSCWISNGIASPALAMPRNQAVALLTTEGVTADSCSGKSGCVYRNVTIDPRQRVDVIEVGEGRGASAGAYTLIPDQSCRKEGGSLLCENGLGTQNFRIWVVPESTAKAAGDSSLEDAVADNLPEPDATSTNDK